MSLPATIPNQIQYASSSMLFFTPDRAVISLPNGITVDLGKAPLKLEPEAEYCLNQALGWLSALRKSK
jgi:hypothetical protein